MVRVRLEVVLKGGSHRDASRRNFRNYLLNV